MEITQIKVKDILPDQDQPRRLFAADKMRQLQKSIKAHGIKVPLTVHDLGNNKYLIVDGERRFRSAVALEMKEVPAIVEKQTSNSDRLIEQFHLQEMKQEWTPIERAMAVDNLATSLNLTLRQASELIGASESDVTRFTQFAQIADKTKYVQTEMPLDYAASFLATRRLAKRLSLEILKEAFPLSSEKKIESVLIELIKNGDIINRRDFVRIKDSLVKEPKLLTKFMAGQLTPQKMYISSKAEGATALRRAAQYAGYTSGWIDTFLKTKDVPLTSFDISAFKRARASIEQVLNLVAE